jgi:hypothetical protein
MLMTQTPLLLFAISLLPGGVPAQAVDPTCISGFVWRVVKPDDLVCVSPPERELIRAENRLAHFRRIGGPRFVPDKCPLKDPKSPQCYAFDVPCKSPFVWRAATPDDYVCVDRERRKKVWADNAQAKVNRVGTPPPPVVGTPPVEQPPVKLTLAVTAAGSGQFLVKGSGFLAGQTVNIRVVDVGAHELFFNTKADSSGMFSVAVSIPCQPGVLYFSANDGRQVPPSVDLTGTLWSNTVPVNCQ